MRNNCFVIGCVKIPQAAVILSILLSLISGCRQNHSTDRNKNERVVKATTYKQSYTFGKLDTTKYPLYDTLYNTFEADSIVLNYNATGAIIERVVQEYNSDRLLIASIRYDENGQATEKTIYTYDSLKRLDQKNYVKSAYEYTKHKYNYKDGKLSTIVETGKRKSSEETRRFMKTEYSDINDEEKYIYRDNLLIEEKRYTNGKFWIGFYYTYDTTNTLISGFSKGTLFDNYRTFKYDQQGNTIEECSLSGNTPTSPLVFRAVHKYDAHNRLTESINYNGFNEPEYVIKTEYLYK